MGGEKHHASSPAQAALDGTPRHNATPQPQPGEKVKRARKKKEPVDAEPVKEKKPRKERSDKGKPQGPRKKKPKIEHSPDEPDANLPAAKKSKITDLVSNQNATPNAAVSAGALPMFSAPYPIQSHENGSTGAPSQADATKMQAPTSTTPRTIRYDPIKDVAVETPISTIAPSNTTFRPSASPSIASIIDPPTALSTLTIPAVSSKVLPSESARPPPSPSNAHITLDPSPPSRRKSLTDNNDTSAMEIDTTDEKQQLPTVKKALSNGQSAAASPKPARAKEQPPPLPQGSGLLSSALFGGAITGDNNDDEAQDIILEIDLKGQTNQVVNFARLAEDKYGFTALYPRLAAQKRHLAEVAARGAALERAEKLKKQGSTSLGDSGDDDMSVDIDQESVDDADVAMSGANGTGTAAGSGTDGPETKKRRRRKVEDYDQDDPFVDDSEMAWEQQAAASKDGFFVYCGPLVPEGEKPAVERFVLQCNDIAKYKLTSPRADGTVKRGRGRGRGGGPGSRGGRGGAVKGDGDGRAARGGGVTRKPRITKAERAMRDKEKEQRKDIAPLLAKPPSYPA